MFLGFTYLFAWLTFAFVFVTILFLHLFCFIINKDIIEIFKQMPRPLGATPHLVFQSNLFVASISNITQNLKLLGAKMTELCSF